MIKKNFEILRNNNDNKCNSKTQNTKFDDAENLIKV